MAGHTKFLNPRQTVFAQHVVSGRSYTEAAKLSGYKDGPNITSIASRIAKTPIVAAEIERQQARARASMELSAERWCAELVNRYNAAAAGVRVGDQANALRALELAGKHLGLFGTHGDAGSAELAARLTANLAALMGKQMAAPVEESAPTVEGEFRAMVIGPHSGSSITARTPGVSAGR